MKKIVVIPLDERPCNYRFTKLLASGTDFEVVVPPLTIMGQKKTPGDIDKIWAFLDEELEHAYGAVLSIDTLLYGGIVPSRLHHDNIKTLQKRLSRLETLRKKYPTVQLYGFNLIMRNPTYSSSDEEPDYYEQVGREIHLRGVYEHKKQLKILTDQEQQDYVRVLAKLDEERWLDYTQRRCINVALNKLVIQYVQQQILDFLIIPQDDASPYGLTALNQQTIREEIKRCQVMSNVLMYPGADEVGNTLLARLINKAHNHTPKVFVKYTSEQSKELIPLYEDRPLGETVKYQILAAGGMNVYSDTDADMIIIVNAPPSQMLNASQAYLKGIEYDAYRTIVEAVAYADYKISQNIPVVIADVAYGNGSDLELIQLLVEYQLLYKLAGYAGWNTSSNTLGTCIPQGMIYTLFGETKEHLNFLSLRYTEDAGYCSTVRQQACSDILPKHGLNYFQADGKRGIVSTEVQKLLEAFIQKTLIDPTYDIHINDCFMPWSRMFEVGLDTKVVKK